MLHADAEYLMRFDINMKIYKSGVNSKLNSKTLLVFCVFFFGILTVCGFKSSTFQDIKRVIISHKSKIPKG
jgi:Mg2+/citrate symporter